MMEFIAGLAVGILVWTRRGDACRRRNRGKGQARQGRTVTPAAVRTGAAGTRVGAGAAAIGRAVGVCSHAPVPVSAARHCVGGTARGARCRHRSAAGQYSRGDPAISIWEVWGVDPNTQAKVMIRNREQWTLSRTIPPRPGRHWLGRFRWQNGAKI